MQARARTKTKKPIARITKVESLIEVAAEGGGPLPAHVHEGLIPELIFNRKRFLFGAEAIDPVTGDRRAVDVEVTRLFQFDGRGTLHAAAGLLSRIRRHLVDVGYEVRVLAEVPNPGAFEANPEALAAIPDFRPIRDGEAKLARYLARRGSISPDNADHVSFSRRVVQRRLIDALLARIRGRLGGIVKAPCGFGKSYSFEAIAAAFPRARIAFVVPGVDNFKKTFAHLLRRFPDVGRHGDGKHQDGRLVVFTTTCLHHMRPGEFDLIVVDEAHTAAADDVAELLGTRCGNAVMIGLSATPEGRGDGADLLVEAIFGPVFWEISYQEATRLGLIVPLVVEWLSMEGLRNPVAGVENSTTRKRLGIWGHLARNKRFAARARKAPDDQQTLIMVGSLYHALKLAKLLPEYQLCYAKRELGDFEKYLKYDEDLLPEGFTPIDGGVRERMRLDFAAARLKKVIATDVWSTGVSFNTLPTLLRADGRSSSILNAQIPGRANRVDPETGKLTALLIDSDDSFDRGFAGNASRRAKDYKDKGWKQVRSR